MIVDKPIAITDDEINKTAGMLTLGVHVVDLLRWYAGDMVEVQACYNRGLALPGNAWDDCIAATFRFASGALGQVTVCWGAAVRLPDDYGIALYGSRGSIVSGRLHVADAYEGMPLPPPAPLPAGADGTRAEVQAVVDSLLHGGTVFCDGRQGGRSAIACLCAIEAAERGTTVEIPNP